MSNEGEQNDNQFQSQVDQDDGRDDDNSTFELISKVESRPFIYNCRDPRHSKRDVINDAWNEIANGLNFKGKIVDGTWCRKKWKALRDYYYKVKRIAKGKSGEGAKDKKLWPYFSAMERVLLSCNEENENTQSNFPGDDSIVDYNQFSDLIQCNDGSGIGAPDEGNCNEKEVREDESTPNSTKRVRKRKSDANDTLLSEKILKVLEEPEEVKDQFYHFGMTICNRLRNVPLQTAEYAMVRISSLLYEIAYPIVYQPSPSESTPN